MRNVGLVIGLTVGGLVLSVGGLVGGVVVLDKVSAKPSETHSVAPQQDATVTSIYDVTGDFPGCNWVYQNQGGVDEATSNDCNALVAYGGYSGYAAPHIQTVRDDPEGRWNGDFAVDGDTWAAIVSNYDDAKMLAKMYDASYEVI